jgi:hypothetical protein
MPPCNVVIKRGDDASAALLAVGEGRGFSQASLAVKRQRRDAPFDFSHHLFVFRRIDPAEAAIEFGCLHILRQVFGGRHDVFLADLGGQAMLENARACMIICSQFAKSGAGTVGGYVIE